MTSPYDTPAKKMHRASVLALHRETSGRPLLYVEDEHAGATRFFLHEGVYDLIPVNWEPRDALAIRETTGVAAVCSEVGAHLARLPDDSCSVVWLDLMKVGVVTETVVHALRVAPYVCVTLSTRGVERQTQCETLLAQMRSVGRMVEHPCVYEGAGGSVNMLKFVLKRGREASSEVIDLTMDETEHTTENVEDTQKRVEEDWAVGDRMKVWWPRHATWYHGKVANLAHQTVLCDYDDGPVRNEWCSRCGPHVARE